MGSGEARHLNAAVELQKGARTVLSLMTEVTPSLEHAALVYLTDAVGQLIEHLKADDRE